MRESLRMQESHAGNLRSFDVHKKWREQESRGLQPYTEENALADPDLLRSVVVRIQLHDESAKHQLYQIFNRGIRYQLVRHLGPADIEDKVHDTFLIVLQAILRNDLRSPERLLGYIRTVVRRQIANHIERAVTRRREYPVEVDCEGWTHGTTPEDSYVRSEEKRLMRQTLSELSPRDREILIRFYLDEMSQEEICAEMGLTLNQFRLLKSRAKARFSELGKRQLRPRLVSKLRAAAG